MKELSDILKVFHSIDVLLLLNSLFLRCESSIVLGINICFVPLSHCFTDISPKKEEARFEWEVLLNVLMRKPVTDQFKRGSSFKGRSIIWSLRSAIFNHCDCLIQLDWIIYLFEFLAECMKVKPHIHFKCSQMSASLLSLNLWSNPDWLEKAAIWRFPASSSYRSFCNK